MKNKLVIIIGICLAFLAVWQSTGRSASSGIGETYTTYKQRAAAPATPAATYNRIYFKTDGKFYYVNSAGAETEVGAGGGDVSTDAIWDAAGDLVQGTGANTAAKLSKGSEGSFLRSGAASLGWSDYIFSGTTGQTYTFPSTTGTLGKVITLATAFIDAGSMIPDTCSGLLQFTGGSNQGDYLAFDGATDEYALFRWSPPSDYDNGTIKAKITWAAGSIMTNGQSVQWGVSCYAVGDGDTTSITAANFATGEITVDDLYATNDETGPIQKISAATAAITVQGTPATGDILYCRVRRNSADTSTKDAWLTGVKIQYGISGTGPAAW